MNHKFEELLLIPTQRGFTFFLSCFLVSVLGLSVYYVDLRAKDLFIHPTYPFFF